MRSRTGTQALTVREVEQMLRHDARSALDHARRMLDTGSESPERPESPEGPVDPDSVAYQRWLLLKGAAQARLGDTEDGARIMREVKGWAEERGETPLLALAHRRLSALFRRVGDPALMLEHAVTAVDLLDDDVDRGDRADHLLGLADALGASGDYGDSIVRYHEAARLAEGDPYLSMAVLNNLAYTQYEAGMATEAMATAERLLAEATRDGEPLLRHVGDTVARVYAAAGRYDDAMAVIEPLCSSVESGEDCDGLVCALLTLAEVRRRSGAHDAAQDALDRATRLIEEYALSGRSIEAMREQAELHAARGRFRDAFETFRDFHLADVELRAMERDARARTLNAIFEATEARRSSDHFRELSVRDPLTGLHNRRHLDSHLAELLERVGHEAPLAVGLIDLDHFKRINDTRSHAVGDDVLRRVAGILEDAVARVEGGLAARIGGEEFLVLLPGHDRGQGADRLHRLREEIAAHPWASLCEGIAVTASIGVAGAPEDGTERGALLQHADRNLYRAKESGRNTVVA